jgi:hypothetical protein
LPSHIWQRAASRYKMLAIVLHLPLAVSEETVPRDYARYE